MKAHAHLLGFIFLFLYSLNGYSTAYTVNSNADAGAGAGTSGDLRYCIQQSAGAAGPHTISFALAVGTVITLNSDLLINNAGNQNGLVIDASNGTNPGIILRRNGGAGGIGIDIGFNIPNVTIKGLVFQNFNTGIRFAGACAGSKVLNSFFGTDLNGTTIAGNQIMNVGVYLSNNCNGITVGGINPGDRNLLSGCMFVNNGDATRYGAIKLENNSNNNVVIGNLIGTDATGTVGLGNGNNTAGNTQPENHHGIYLLNSSINTIAYNLISASQGVGIYTENFSNSITIKGNRIGTDITGMSPIPNLAAGIFVDKGTNYQIGGITVLDRNIISGNRGAADSRPCRAVYCGNPSGLNSQFDNTNICGIYMKDVTNSSIFGNYIGVDATGLSTGAGNNMGNLYAGIKMEGNSNFNTIGGNDARFRNIIGGNGFDFNPINSYVGHGILLGGAPGTNNISVFFNFVGIGADGSTIVGNRQDGVSFLGASNCTIGNTGKGNVISGNGWGVFMQSDFSNNALSNQCTGNKIFSNFIGTDSTGLLARGNGIAPVHAGDGGGICLQHKSNSNQLGGTAAGQGNVISGNVLGIIFKVSNATFGSAPNANTVFNNIIGLDKNGVNALPNTGAGPDAGCGVVLNEGAVNNTIGGLGANQRNIISGNDQNGVRTFNAVKGTYTNTVSGNYIGLAADGVTDKGNGMSGVYIEMVNGMNVTSNVISGNTQMGIFINNSNSTVVNGNFVGTNATATAAVQNDQHGIFINNGSQNNTIGTAGNGNTVSGNAIHGILVLGMTSTGNNILANYVGINSSSTPIPNLVHGIVLDGTTANNVGAAGAGNFVSGNITGILINNATNNNIYANYVGTNVAGTAKISNTDNGILLDNASTGNNIGGAAANQGNVVSGNTHMGVKMNNSSNNFVRNNFIGTNAAGTADLGNGWHGLDLTSSNTIVITNNVISGNGDLNTLPFGNGISALSSSTLTVTGNFLGTNATGTAAIPNFLAGFSCSNSNSNIIGGLTAAARNIISGNGDPGIYMNNSDLSVIQGNYIGTAADGVTNIGNTSTGIYIENGSNDNTIGGVALGATNNIAYNGVNGITIADAGSFNNSITRNSIFCNVRRGIELNGLGNNNYAKPVILATSTASVLNGTSPALAFIEIFMVGPAACKTCGASGIVNDSIQGKIYVTTVQADAGGNWTYNNGSAFASDVTATASSNNSGTYNTSEFSNCRLSCVASTAPTTASSDRNNYCTTSGGNIILTATGGSGSQLEWYTGSCAGTTVGTGNGLSLAAPTATTTYFVRWLSAACANSSCVSVTVIVKNLPTDPTSGTPSRNNFCANDAGNINLTALGGTGDSLVWYTGSCGGTKIGKGSPLSIASPAVDTDYFVRWENGVCPASNCVTVSVNTEVTPTPSIVGNASNCANTSPVAYSTVATGNTFLWSSTGGVTITSATNTDNITASILASAGSVTVTETAGTCSTTVSKNIALTPATSTASVGTDKTICTTAINNLGANNPSVGVGVWSVVTGSAIFSPDVNTYNATVTGLSNGLNELVWTVTGACGINDDTISLTVGANGLLVNASTTPDTSCFGSPKDIKVKTSGSGSGNYTYNWTSSDNSFSVSTADANVTVRL